MAGGAVRSAIRLDVVVLRHRAPQLHLVGHNGMTIGIPQFRDPQEQRLHKMLPQPFRDEK